MGRRKGYNREDVLDKAMRLFWRKGYEGTHLQELVEVTTVNRFGLYQEFGGKAGLFDAAMDRYLILLTETMTPLSNTPKGIDNILTYFDTLNMDFFLHGCFLTNSITEKNVIDGKTYGKMMKALSDFEDLVRENLKAAVNVGDIKKGVDTEALVKFIATLDLGIVTYGINANKNDKKAIVTLFKDFMRTLKASQ